MAGEVVGQRHDLGVVDGRVLSTVLRKRIVSPSNMGCGSTISPQPRLAKTFCEMSVTLCPVTSARVRVEFTSGFPKLVRAA